jgi:Asp-tRNA(Asn)/Glu-tRNA(Gln) amidotransferase A subunit family amidase/ketopantoate reductase
VRDGHDVLVCDADPAVVAAIKADGLRIEGPVEQFTARPAAIGPGELPSAIDFPVLVACKQVHTAAAAELLAGRLAGEAFVASLQNGLPSPALAAAAGPGRVVQACVNFGADVVAPGVVMRGNRGTFKIGELDGTPSARIDALAADIADAEATTQVMGFVWGKEAYGAMLFATAVSDLAIHEVFDDPAYHPLLLAVAGEVLGQAPVRPLALDGFDPDDLPGSLSRLADFNRRSAKSHSGIYRDLMIRRRKTETEAILGPLQGFLIRRIAELITAIEAGTRTCCRENLDLLAAYERLGRLGRPLNAVVSVAGAPRRSPAGPLSGRPVAVKDIIAVEGLPTRCGSPSTSDAPAAEDAALVSRLRAAGAEVFATAQCLEFAAGFANPRVGDTRNPRDPARTSGGSSGGSAALVAAGVCDLAIGTDTGGSIRIPAAYCGVVGLKPTYGLVPTDGVFPLSPSLDHAGTLTATATDSIALLQAIAGPLPALPAAGVPVIGVPVIGVPVIGVLSAQLADPSVTPEVRAAVRTALTRLAAAGWQLREVKPPWLEEPERWEEALTAIVGHEAAASHAGRDTSQDAEGTRALLAFGAAVTPEQYASARAAQAELSVAVEETLAGVDALAGPTVGYCAPEQDPPFGVGDDNAEGRFTGPYNLTGHPAVSIPVPAPGLPVGLQLAGRRDGDLALLELAAAAQRLLTAEGGKLRFLLEGPVDVH